MTTRSDPSLIDLPFRYTIVRIFVLSTIPTLALGAAYDGVENAATLSLSVPLNHVALFISELALNCASQMVAVRRFAKHCDRFSRWTLEPSVARPPASRITSICRFLFSDRSIATVIDPEYAELCHEWMEAERKGMRWRARWICYVRGPWSMLSTMISLAGRPVSQAFRHLAELALDAIRRMLGS